MKSLINESFFYPNSKLIKSRTSERVKIRKKESKLKRELSKIDKDDPRREEMEDALGKLWIKQFTIKIFIVWS